MNLGLKPAQWHAISEGWRPADRAFAFELLHWMWENRCPLPANVKTLQRLARADDTKAFRAAWSRLSASGVFVDIGTLGWRCPLQDEARGVQQARVRAGHASVTARRQARMNQAYPKVKIVLEPIAEQRVQQLVEQTVDSPPVEKLWKSGGKPVDAAGSPVEIGPPQTPPRTSVLGTGTVPIEQEHGVPAAGAAFSQPTPTIEETLLTSKDLDRVAVALATLLLGNRQAHTWDDFRDEAAAAIARFQERPPGLQVSPTDLTYRVWDEAFLGSFRDRFVTNRTGIRLAVDRA